MFTINQDYYILDSKVPVLTLQTNGQFEHKNSYFLEFVVQDDNKTLEKIKTVCAPFDYSTAVAQAISKHNLFHLQRLFLLTGPDAIKNSFKESDDFLAMAFCADGEHATTIQYFEVNYLFRRSYEPNQKYRRVGTSAINALKQVYQDRELGGRSALDALNFWFKNDFTRMDDRELYLHWNQR